MVTHLILLGVTAALFFSAGAIGRLAGRMAFGEHDRAFMALAAPVIGLAILAITSFALLAVGGVPPSLHLAMPLMGVMIGCRDLRELGGDLVSLRRELAWAWWPLTLILVGVSVFMLAFALGPVVDWDSLSFHDRVPNQLLEARALIVPADNLHVAQLGMVHLAGIPLRVVGAGGAVALVSTAATLLLILAGSLLAHRISGGVGALLAAAGLAGSPMLLLVGVTPRVDAPLGLAIVLATLAWMSDLRDRDGLRTGWVICLLGCAAAIKFQGIAFAAIMLPMVLWSSRHRFRSRTAGLAMAAGLSLPYLIPNLVHFGSPFYPFFAAPRLEPWIASLANSAVLPATFHIGFLETLASARQDFGLWAFFFEPALLTIEYEGVWYRPSPILLLLPLAAWCLPRRLAAAAIVPSLCYVLTVLLISSSTNLRYLLPAVVILTIASASGVGMLISRLRVGGVPRSLAVAIALLGAAQASLRFTAQWNNATAFKHFLGEVDDLGFGAAHPDPTVTLLAEIPAMVRSAVPTDGLVLLLFEARGGAFDVPVLADTRATAWPLLAQTTAPASCLAGSGITHVLLNGGAVSYYLRRGADPEALFLPELARFVERCLEPRAQRNGFELYAVATRTPTGTPPTSPGP